MQTQKNIIVYYGNPGAFTDIISERRSDENHEIFVVQEHHKEEVPAEYYDRPEEYYRLKFKQRGYTVILQAY